MKTRVSQSDNGNVLICALCTIIIVSLIGSNVLVNCSRHYNVTAKQLKAWKEAMYAAEAGGDAGFDEVRKLLGTPSNPSPTPGSTDGWSGSGPWTKTFSNFGAANSLSTTVTIDKLTDSTGTIPNTTPFYRIRAVGTAKLLGLPRVGLSDQFFAGGPNFAANSATRGVGDTLLRKIDFKYDHFKATYGDGDGNNIGVGAALSGSPPIPQVSRRIELVAVPKYYVFGGAMRLTTSFFGPGSAGIVDSYSSTHPNDPTPPTIGGGGAIPANTSSYWGPNPINSAYLADAHDGDIAVGSPTFSEGGPIWGDVTTNGGNVTHSGYTISGTIDNNVPFTIPPLQVDSGFSGVAPIVPASNNTITAGGSATTTVVYSSDLNNGTTLTIKNGQTDTGNILMYPNKYPTVKVLVNGNIKGSIIVEPGVTAQIWFTGNIDVKASDLVNQSVDEGKSSPGLGDDPTISRVAHMQFYGISPAAGVTQTIDIGSPGNVFATFYAPSADMTVTGNPDIFSAIVARSFAGNGSGGGNTGFHYDKWLNQVNIGVVTDYQVASYVEDVR